MDSGFRRNDIVSFLKCPLKRGYLNHHFKRLEIWVSSLFCLEIWVSSLFCFIRYPDKQFFSLVLHLVCVDNNNNEIKKSLDLKQQRKIRI